MPLASVLEAGGILALGPLLGEFRAAQAAIIAVAAALPPLTYAAARSLGAGVAAALVAAALVGLGGAFAPSWVSLDNFAPAAALGTAFFLAFGRAAAGDVRAGAAAGLAVGLLYLARAEGALFGVPLLALALRAPSRRAGLAGAAVAVAIGLAWFARNLAAGPLPELFARSVLLVRYEQFFAVAPPSPADFLAALPTVAAARANALVTNAVTVALAFLFVLVVPLAYGLRWLGGLPQVRAFVALLVTLYLIESLLWTLHSVRGLAFHTLSAFFPFGIALAVAGGERWFSRRPATLAAVAATATLAGGAAVSVSALMEWDRAFNAPFRARLAALDAVPPGPIVAIDAAAWRWISGRPAVITPADSLELGVCAADAYGAGSLILEPAHFSAYDALYRGGDPPLGLGFPMRRPAAESGEIRIYPVVRGAECAVIWRDP